MPSKFQGSMCKLFGACMVLGAAVGAGASVERFKYIHSTAEPSRVVLKRALEIREIAFEYLLTGASKELACKVLDDRRIVDADRKAIRMRQYDAPCYAVWSKEGEFESVSAYFKLKTTVRGNSPQLAAGARFRNGQCETISVVRGIYPR